MLQNRDCVRLGPPAEGDVVQVRWTDGLIYGAKFVAAHVIPMYQVRESHSLTHTQFNDCLNINHKMSEYTCVWKFSTTAHSIVFVREGTICFSGLL